MLLETYPVILQDWHQVHVCSYTSCFIVLCTYLPIYYSPISETLSTLFLLYMEWQWLNSVKSGLNLSLSASHSYVGCGQWLLATTLVNDTLQWCFQWCYLVKGKGTGIAAILMLSMYTYSTCTCTCSSLCILSSLLCWGMFSSCHSCGSFLLHMSQHNIDWCSHWTPCSNLFLLYRSSPHSKCASKCILKLRCIELRCVRA